MDFGEFIRFFSFRGTSWLNCIGPTILQFLALDRSRWISVLISTLISTCQSVEVGKLSLEAQSGSLFGTLPRSSVRSMQVASSESDSGSGSIGSPGATTVTPMATIAEDRGTELSFLESC